MAWPDSSANRGESATPENTRERMQEKSDRGDQDTSAEGARKIAQDVEDQGGFWGPRK